MNYHFSIVELVVRRSRSTQCHHLNNLSSTRVSVLYIPNNKAGCWSKSFFTIYGKGSHLGRVTQLISLALINFHIPVPNL